MLTCLRERGSFLSQFANKKKIRGLTILGGWKQRSLLPSSISIERLPLLLVAVFFAVIRDQTSGFLENSVSGCSPQRQALGDVIVRLVSLMSLLSYHYRCYTGCVERLDYILYTGLLNAFLIIECSWWHGFSRCFSQTRLYQRSGESERPFKTC